MSENQVVDRHPALWAPSSIGEPMRFDHVPVIDGRYWLAISLASIAGCNLGDLSRA